MEKYKPNYIIPRGQRFAQLPVGFGARLICYFEQLPKKPPKHTAAVLLYLCELTQSNNIDSAELRGIEVSARQLANDIGAKNHKTVNNALHWLEIQEWATIDSGHNQARKTVATLNIEKVMQFSTATAAPSFYYNEMEQWHRALKNGV